MRITIADVARRARVSKTTVSRVLNDKVDVDAATSRRIREVIAEMGYVPSARAVGLASGRTQTIGMLVPVLTWPWISEMLQGIVDTLETHGYGLLLYTMNKGAVSLAQFEKHVSANAFDGLVVVEPPDSLDYITALYASGLPVVMIDDRGRHPQFPSIATTNRLGARCAAKHLHDAGRSRIAVITGPEEFGCTQERLDGFQDQLSLSGLELDPKLVLEGDFTRESGTLAVRTLITEGVAFDGVFAHNDLMAAGALRGLRDAGRLVPDDVAVVGFDDLPIAADTQPSLTTIRQPVKEMGEAAAAMLLAHLSGTPLPEGPQIVPTSLVIRESAP
ncbi:MAG: LacI family transcriptional regulator [Actinomycetota bacterium]|jgi:LacI family transcriptional regulator|nr:LacI family transcriptional regulator [Actinomycetota bacterium]